MMNHSEHYFSRDGKVFGPFSDQAAGAGFPWKWDHAAEEWIPNLGTPPAFRPERMRSATSLSISKAALVLCYREGASKFYSGQISELSASTISIRFTRAMDTPFVNGTPIFVSILDLDGKTSRIEKATVIGVRAGSIDVHLGEQS